MQKGVTWQWIAGLALTLVLAFGGWAWATTVDRVLDLEKDGRVRGERIIRLETELKNEQEQLDRMEQKLDRLLEAR